MKVAILSHFRDFQDSYALHVGWLERARLLEYFGVDFDFLVNQNCKTHIYPKQRNVLPTPPSGKPFKDRVATFQSFYEKALEVYDVILTADLIYQRKGNHLAYNQAARNALPKLKAWWCHWIHSSWVDRPGTLPPYPENLRYEMMDRSFLVYLNSYELGDLAKMYSADPRLCRAVYNPKDFRSFNDFHHLAWDIVRRMDLMNRDAVQIFPHCATRMTAKGIDGIINVFSALKKKGLRVAIIFANANSRKVPAEIEAKKRFIEASGLVENEDFIFTSDFMVNRRPLPRKAVADLFKIANLFVFASWRETVGNVFQEAKISGNLLVLTKALPCLREMGGPEAIFFDTDHKTPGRHDGQTGDFQRINYHPSKEQYFNELADRIIPRLPSREHLWAFSFERIWYKQFLPLLEDAYALSKGYALEEVLDADQGKIENNAQGRLPRLSVQQLREMGIEVVLDA